MKRNQWLVTWTTLQMPPQPGAGAPRPAAQHWLSQEAGCQLLQCNAYHAPLLAEWYFPLPETNVQTQPWVPSSSTLLHRNFQSLNGQPKHVVWV